MEVIQLEEEELNQVEQVMILTDNENEKLINLLLRKTKKEIENYCKKPYSDRMENVLVDIVVIKVNRLGTEGLKSQSYSGESESYQDKYPENILRELDGFKNKVNFI